MAGSRIKNPGQQIWEEKIKDSDQSSWPKGVSKPRPECLNNKKQNSRDEQYLHTEGGAVGAVTPTLPFPLMLAGRVSCLWKI